jgi:hypothetical protein
MCDRRLKISTINDLKGEICFMEPQQTEQELTLKSDHELLVMLVKESPSIRQILEAGYDYSINMNEKRSGAWGAQYSGSGQIRTK